MTEVVSVRQKKPLGLGHAVLCARDLVGDEPFAVMLADDLIDAEVPGIRQLLNIFEETNESVIALMEVPQAEVHQYGVIKGREIKKRLYQVEATVEKPLAKDAPSRMAIIGRYVLRPEIFKILQNLPPGRGGEIQLDRWPGAIGRANGKYLAVSLSATVTISATNSVLSGRPWPMR